MEQYTNRSGQSQSDRAAYHMAMEEIAYYEHKNNVELTQEEKDIRFEWYQKGAKYMRKFVYDVIDRAEYGDVGNDPSSDYRQGFADGITSIKQTLYDKLVKRQ